MHKIRYPFVAGIAVSAVLIAPLVAAGSSSATIQSLSSTSVNAGSKITFSVQASGFSSAPMYQLSDSFTGSSANSNNLSGGGQFFWVPTSTDVGTHALTVNVTDPAGDSALVTQTIIVLPPPSLSIGPVSPGTTIAPGTTLTFGVSATGFTDPSFYLSDNFSGSTINDSDISSSGSFSWTPDTSQNGQHLINIYATDPQGHSAQANESVQVGAGATLVIGGLSPGTSVSLGQTVSFSAVATNFFPTSFSISDSFPKSSVTNYDINTSGQFTWTPGGGDVGRHVLRILGQVGAFGQSASTTQTITVLGSGGTAPTAPSGATSTTSSPHGAQLAALKAQLQQVETQITAQGASGTKGSAASAQTPASPGSYDNNSYVFKSSIGPGESGTDVIELQLRLIALGYLHAWPTGYYGSGTEAAVRAFQTAHRIAAKGYVGSTTRAVLNTAL